jgi:hypothetical protein
MSMTSKMMYSVLGFSRVPKDTGSVITPTVSIIFSTEAIQRLCWFFEQPSIIAQFF